MRRLTLLAAYSRSAFLTWLSWRSFAFTLVANQAVTPLIGLAVWSAALPGRGMLDYFSVLLFVRLMTVSYENHTFSERIYAGDLAEDLLRPHPVLLPLLGENLAIRVWHLIIGLPVLLLVPLLLPLQLQGAQIAAALPAVLLAAALRFLFTYLLALSAFWTERAHSAVTFGNTLIFLLGGEAAPVWVLPQAIRPWAEALPFRAMSGFAAEVATGLVAGERLLLGYAWQALWLGVLALISTAVWRSGVRRYTVIGG